MSLKKYLQHNTPVILSGLASIGVIITAVTAVKATPKAIQLLEEAEKNKGEELSTWEKAKATALTYLPSILIGGTTIICIFGAQSLNRKQQASMMSFLNDSLKRLLSRFLRQNIILIEIIF